MNVFRKFKWQSFDDIVKEIQFFGFPLYRKIGNKQIFFPIDKNQQNTHTETAVYLKIKRSDDYAIFCLSEWLDLVHELGYDCFILCDDPVAITKIQKRIIFPNNKILIIPSDKKTLKSSLRKMISKCWLNAGLAHFTTFSHADKNHYKYFWNIDADDTTICAPLSTRQRLIKLAEDYLKSNNLDIFSYDMWWSQSKGTHWSFGITFTKTIPNFKGFLRPFVGSRWQQSYHKYKVHFNVDWFFTYLKENKILRCESFYLENCYFIHWGDFLRNNIGSGLSINRNGVAERVIQKNILDRDTNSEFDLQKDSIKFDLQLTEASSRQYLNKNVALNSIPDY